MPRPRFAKLPPERRRQILDVAAEEFATHGYEGASYNRILERAGLSKGVAYYWFDGKEDLFATVLRDALERRLAEVPAPAPSATAEGFWEAQRRIYTRTIEALRAHPEAAALARAWARSRHRLGATDLDGELTRGALEWFGRTLAEGRRLGAVRRDLPEELLVAATFGLVQAVDGWMLERWGTMDEAEVDGIAATLFGLIRRMLEP